MANITGLINGINTRLITESYNALSEKPVKKFADRDSAVAKVTALVLKTYSDDEEGRRKFLIDMRKVGVDMAPGENLGGPDTSPARPLQEAIDTVNTKEAPAKPSKGKKAKPAAPAPAPVIEPAKEAPLGPGQKRAATKHDPDFKKSITGGFDIYEEGKWRKATDAEVAQWKPDGITVNKQAATVRQAAKLREEREELAKEAKKAVKVDPDDEVTFSPARQKALKEIVRLVKESGKDECAYTDDLAKGMMTDSGIAINHAKALASLGYVTIEDDSTEEGGELYAIKLTAKAANPVKAKKEGGAPGNPGPNSKFAGKRLYKTCKENPRKAGTHGYNSWEALKDGMTFEEYKAAGGRNNDLQWDIDRQWVEVR